MHSTHIWYIYTHENFTVFLLNFLLKNDTWALYWVNFRGKKRICIAFRLVCFWLKGYIKTLGGFHLFLNIFFLSGNVYFTQLYFLLILFLYVYFHSIGARAAVKVSLMSSVFLLLFVVFHLPFHYNASLRSTHIQSHLSEHYISKILHFAQVRFHCPFLYIYIGGEGYQ